MIEYISPLVSLYKTLTEGIRSINVKARSKEKYKIQRKIISIQIILENIIETAEQIFAILDVPIKENSKLDKIKKDELISLTNSQGKNLNELLMTLRADTSDYILKLFAPQLRRNIEKHIYMKQGRIVRLSWALRQFDSRKLKKIYNKEYYKEGIEQVKQLKDCSRDLSDFIKEHINLEVAILIH